MNETINQIVQINKVITEQLETDNLQGNIPIQWNLGGLLRILTLANMSVNQITLATKLVDNSALYYEIQLLHILAITYPYPYTTILRSDH